MAPTQTAPQTSAGPIATKAWSPVRNFLGLKIAAGVILLAVPVLLAASLFGWNEARTSRLGTRAAPKLENFHQAHHATRAQPGLIGPQENALDRESQQAKKPASDIRELFKR